MGDTRILSIYVASLVDFRLRSYFSISQQTPGAALDPSAVLLSHPLVFTGVFIVPCRNVVGAIWKAPKLFDSVGGLAKKDERSYRVCTAQVFSLCNSHNCKSRPRAGSWSDFSGKFGSHGGIAIEESFSSRSDDLKNLTRSALLCVSTDIRVRGWYTFWCNENQQFNLINLNLKNKNDVFKRLASARQSRRDKKSSFDPSFSVFK